MIDVKNRCEFNVDVRMMKTFLNYFEIYLQINELNHFKNKFFDLQFFFIKRCVQSEEHIKNNHFYKYNCFYQNYLNVNKK